MPPPSVEAELPLTVHAVSVRTLDGSEPTTSTPPPSPAELPLIVQSVSVAVP